MKTMNLHVIGPSKQWASFVTDVHTVALLHVGPLTRLFAWPRGATRDRWLVIQSRRPKHSQWYTCKIGMRSHLIVETSEGKRRKLPAHSELVTELRAKFGYRRFYVRAEYVR